MRKAIPAVLIANITLMVLRLKRDAVLVVLTVLVVCGTSDVTKHVGLDESQVCCGRDEYETHANGEGIQETHDGSFRRWGFIMGPVIPTNPNN